MLFPMSKGTQSTCGQDLGLLGENLKSFLLLAVYSVFLQFTHVRWSLDDPDAHVLLTPNT